ncbi:MAG: hypothetical protein EA426_12575 [Spirochaetaceae bacterium]|nr:MAG: hypothetical protein EA426_12575 [Spirochaetaceae bacterium]
MLVLVVSVFAFSQEAVEDAEPVAVAGTWIWETGELRWEWELNATEYEFRSFDGDNFTIGSRGSLSVDGDVMTVVAVSVTNDGENWELVTLEPERATRSYHVSVRETVMRLGVVDTPRFFVEYRRPVADVPADAAGTQ